MADSVLQNPIPESIAHQSSVIIKMEELSQFWAKTVKDHCGEEIPGISVFGHCLNVGFVARTILAGLPPTVRRLLPGIEGQATPALAALHDIGKITLGFQVKCATWPLPGHLGERAKREIVESVSDHALVSQVFLQDRLKPFKAQLWAAAIGAHHGRPKGRTAKRPEIEVDAEWAEHWRDVTTNKLMDVLGPLPNQPPKSTLGFAHSDLWLLAGLITVADWIGSNEAFFPPDRELPPDESGLRAKQALAAIGWPGGRLVSSSFSKAFTGTDGTGFQPNAVQTAVAGASPGLVIVEAPMGCGKTEAALHLAQHWIAEGHHHGLYFALPTQVTSNRIHHRVAKFLSHTLEDRANLRLAHGHAWLEADFNLELEPARNRYETGDQDNPFEDLREARSWFASSKQALLAPYGVGTIDQALQGMVRLKHFFVRRFALAGKVVILDEIHSYDLYTGTLVGALVGELLNLGCSVIVLSATLISTRRQELLAAAGCAERDTPDSYPLISCAARGIPVRQFRPQAEPSRRIDLRVESLPEIEVLEELVRRAQAGQHVLWIRNTVIEAQTSFAALRGLISECPVELGLLHSRFPFCRRQELEVQWLDRLGRHRDPMSPGSILIATQVVEQSVDIDLDFIVSDLAPTDMLFQRLGRLWRHDRPLGHRKAQRPDFWIRLPELDSSNEIKGLKAALGRSSRVYAPYVLLRSAAVWRGRHHVHLPDDIRPLLEATYADPAETEPTAWQALRSELEEEKRALKTNADAAMSVFGLPLENPEEDGALTRRKGAPTVPVLVLRSVRPTPDGRGWLLAPPDDSATARASDFEWSRETARFIHQWLVRVPKWQVPNDVPRPRWLMEHANRDAMVACLSVDGRLHFGDTGSPASYHPDFGIFTDRPIRTQPQPQPWSDDDDEFDP